MGLPHKKNHRTFSLISVQWWFLVLSKKAMYNVETLYKSKIQKLNVWQASADPFNSFPTSRTSNDAIDCVLPICFSDLTQLPALSQLCTSACNKCLRMVCWITLRHFWKGPKTDSTNSLAQKWLKWNSLDLQQFLMGICLKKKQNHK